MKNNLPTCQFANIPITVWAYIAPLISTSAN
jgi:hypothetical protein